MDQQILAGDVQWHPIGQTSNQLILYHPPSHALSVQPHPEGPEGPASSSSSSRARPLLLSYRTERAGSETPIESISRSTCPYCQQLLPQSEGVGRDALGGPGPGSILDGPRFQHLRNESVGSTSSYQQNGEDAVVSGGYFQILERAHEGSRPPSPRLREKSPSVTPQPESAAGRGSDYDSASEDGLPGKGYYERFFREEARLGIGAEGSVYLATHMIGGNVLGTYAVKKIAVGTSKSYLVKMLREVRLLETLRHPNIIPYHHAWIEPTRFSSFGPPINALHVLMMYATAGNLDLFLINRSHSTQPSRPDLSAGDIADNESLGMLPKAERIKAFKKRRQKGAGGRKATETRGVMLLSLEEITALFGDVVEGLAFLHANSILHLDLKCSNVLLHWEDDKLTPRAMISDFGTSEEMIRGKRQRTGHTGTMEYMAPETLVTDQAGQWRPSDSHADMWSLGMILHKLLFLHLPYSDTEDFDQLHSEILAYTGFMPSAELIESCKRRHVPRDLLFLLSSLVNVDPDSRPSADKVRTGLRGLNAKTSRPTSGLGGLVTRFKSPFSQGSTSHQNDRREAMRQQNWPGVSPVRSILALPSPTATEHASSNVASVSDRTRSDTSFLGIEERYLHSLLFALKILSLQPGVFLSSDLPLTTAIFLIAIDLFSLQRQSWLTEGITGIIHFALLSLYSDSSSRGSWWASGASHRGEREWVAINEEL